MKDRAFRPFRKPVRLICIFRGSGNCNIYDIFFIFCVRTIRSCYRERAIYTFNFNQFKRRSWSYSNVHFLMLILTAFPPRKSRFFFYISNIPYHQPHTAHFSSLLIYNMERKKIYSSINAQVAQIH